MKKTIATLIILAATSQVQAAGFYQDIIKQGNQAESSGLNSGEFKYTPLYIQVTGKDKQNNGHLSDVDRESMFTYTPLYKKVAGHLI